MACREGFVLPVELLEQVQEQALDVLPARPAVLGGIPWQGCQSHLQQNAQAYVLYNYMQSEVTDWKYIYNF